MKKFFSFVLSIFVAGALISCSAISSDDSSSGLVVQLPSKSARSALPEWAEEVDYFTVEVSSRDGKSFKEQNQSFQNDSEASQKNDDTVAKQTATWGTTVRFEELPVGLYTVKVLAKNESGKTLGGDEANTQVEEGRATSVTITIKKYDSSAGNDEEDEEIELTFDGTVSFNDTEYKTLSGALLAAATVSPTSGVNTITLNGNVKENLFANSEGASPWLISQNLIIDLNGKTLSWGAFTANENNQVENPLFQVESGKTLLIKNGTITSESGVEHSNILIETATGTVVLNSVVIKNVTALSILKISENGSLYCDKVTVKDCKTSESPTTTYPIYVASSCFYAKETNIENVLAPMVSVVIFDDSQGAFVGGSITLTSTESLSENKSDKALSVLTSGTNFAIASSTIYSDRTNHGAPVAVGGGAILNLANGFRYKYFDSDSFTVSEKHYANADGGEVYIDAETLSLTLEPNIIAAGTSAKVTKDSASTEEAVQLGSGSNNVGYLYMSGKSEIYGLVGLAYSSAIIQTGEIESDIKTKIYFGSDISSYANANGGNYPLYWGVSRKDGDKENAFDFDRDKFEIYNADSYEIKATTRTVSGTNSEADGNTIYAPVLKTASSGSSSAGTTGTTSNDGK